MIYLPAEHIPAFLLQESRRLGNPAVVAVTPWRLRQWVHREKVKRSPAGYDALSLGLYLESRFGRVA